MLALAVSVFGVEAAATYAAPILFIVVPLLGGCYVGEPALHRAMRRRACGSRSVDRGPLVARGIRAALQSFPRGGGLIAYSLAVRPPPVAAL